MNAPLRFAPGERIEIVLYYVDDKPAVTLEADVIDLADAHSDREAIREAMAGYDEAESFADHRERLRRIAEILAGEES